MTSQEMIDKIYEVIADKTLSFGCIIKIITCGIWMQPANLFYTRLVSEGYKNIKSTKVDSYTLSNIGFQEMGIGWKKEGKPDERTIRIEDGKIFGLDIHSSKVIGHPVMIGDILDYLQSNSLLSECIDLLGIWNNKRKPIENQSEYCIKYIYNLVTNHVPKKENSN